jgi:hypothetical protein
MINVISEVISGSIVNEESPTNPLVRLAIAFSFLISNPRIGATILSSFEGEYLE